MTYIFIRHDKKKYTNGRGPEGSPRFDPPIDYTESSPHEQIFKDITPTRIFTSPFLRCRQTAKRAYPNISIETVPLFSDYLGNWKDIVENDFTPFTWRALKKFFFEKSYGQFQKRMLKAYTNMILPKPQKDEVFLVVIHGICLKSWYKLTKESGDGKITLFGSDPTEGFKIDIIRDK
jgi:broad specificity phosphatase PhoE